MGRLSWKYIAFLVALIGIYLLLLYFMPKKFNWFVSLYQKDRAPFGTYVFKTLSDRSWIASINTSNKSLYELNELSDPNLLVLCEEFVVGQAEIETILNLVENGKTALISAHQMDTIFLDSVGVKLNKLSFSFFVNKIWEEDSLGVKFIEKPFDPSNIYWFPEQLLPQYFESFAPNTSKVIAENTDGKPVLLYVSYGKGTILLSSTPLVFTNFSMLRNDNSDFVAGILSYLKPGSLHWTEYYQLGRMEAQTPLRYVLSEPSLKWALYILMCAILISMVFDVKRKQRIIPVITPLKNETLDFVRTISRLYFQKRDHQDLAAKKILHFTDHIKQHLHIDINDEISIVISKVAAKTGSEEKEVLLLFEQMNHVSKASYISPKELKLLMHRMEKCMDVRMRE